MSKKKEIKAWMYDVISTPLITEKAMMGSENGQVTFQVPLTATKPQIKEAVETIFDVKVENVNTLRLKGKRKVFRGIRGQRVDTKKAIVRLAEGQNIDVTTGV